MEVAGDVLVTILSQNWWAFLVIRVPLIIYLLLMHASAESSADDIGMYHTFGYMSNGRDSSMGRFVYNFAFFLPKLNWLLRTARHYNIHTAFLFR
jgi:hypothetical protein